MNKNTGFSLPVTPHLRSEKGMALVITLMILVIITAVVVEFSYGVYTTTASLHNWKDSQRLSFVAGSGITLAVKTISDTQDLYAYTYPDRIELPVENVLEGFKGSLLIRTEDENSKFNLNSLVAPNGITNNRAYDSFRRLLKNQGLDDTISEWVADWIDKDNLPRMRDSESGSKNAYMESVDELLLIKGIDEKTYEKLSPFVTVYGLGRTDSNLVNINTAPIPVIMSLDERITGELAERIIDYRSLSPFEAASDIVRVAGFEGSLGTSLMGRIVVKASNFRITSVAGENRIKRVIESVFEIRNSSNITRYWREY